MRENRMSGSARGVPGSRHSYRRATTILFSEDLKMKNGFESKVSRQIERLGNTNTLTMYK